MIVVVSDHDMQPRDSSPLVGGGDPPVRRIAGAIAARRPHLADRATTVVLLFGVDLGVVDGRNMLR